MVRTTRGQDVPDPATTFARKVGLGFAAIGTAVLSIAVLSMLALVVSARHKQSVETGRLRRLITVHELAESIEHDLAAGYARLVLLDEASSRAELRARTALLGNVAALRLTADVDTAAQLDAIEELEGRHHRAVEAAVTVGIGPKAATFVHPLGEALRAQGQALQAGIEAAYDAAQKEARELAERAKGFIVAAAVIGLLAAAWLARWLASRLINLYRAEQEAQKLLEGAFAELQLLIDALPALVAHVGPDQRLRFINRQFADWLGAPRDALVGRDHREVLAGSTFAGAVDCISGALDGRATREDYRVRGVEGELREVEVRCMARFEAGGRPGGAVVLVTDLTDERRARERARLLAELGERLATSPELEVEADLARVVEVVVPELAARATIELDLPDEARRRVSSRAGGGDSPGGERHAVPLMAHGVVLGSLELEAVPGRHFREDDRRFAEELARRVALAVESARLHRATARALAEREDLLAIVSHDLRNPLGVILVRIEQLARQVNDPTGRRTVASIEKAAERMDSLIRTLLDASRIETGRLTLERTPISPGTLLADAAEMLEALATEKSVRLEIAEARTGPIFADRERILQVLENLLGNAIKFSPPGATVELSAQDLDDHLRFCVLDHGAGVNEADRGRIFERYVQGKRKRRRGLGLGLYIARGIVEAHGGHIWVEGTPGGGACFCFVLPAAHLAMLETPDEAGRSPEPH